MRKLFVLMTILCGCAASAPESSNDKGVAAAVEVGDYPETQPDKLSPQQRTELRRSLDVFYSGNSEEWQRARIRILAMGPEGVEALAIFMIKFFYAGKEDVALDARTTDIAEYWASAHYELYLLQEKAVPYLVIAMAHPAIGSSGRAQCSMTLVKIGNPAVPLLLSNIDRGTPEFQGMVLQTLGNIGDVRAVKPIISLYRNTARPQHYDEDVEDPTLSPRFYSVKAIGEIGDKEGLPLIEEALDDPNPVVRKKAVEMSTEFSCPEALPVLEKALTVSRTCAIGQQQKIKNCIRKIAARQ